MPGGVGGVAGAILPSRPDSVVSRRVIPAGTTFMYGGIPVKVVSDVEVESHKNNYQFCDMPFTTESAKPHNCGTASWDSVNTASESPAQMRGVSVLNTTSAGLDVQTTHTEPDMSAQGVQQCSAVLKGA